MSELTLSASLHYVSGWCWLHNYLIPAALTKQLVHAALTYCMLMRHWRFADGWIMARNTGWNCLSFFFFVTKESTFCLMSIRTLVSVKEWFVVGMHKWFFFFLSASQWAGSYPLLMKLQPVHRTDHMKPAGFYYPTITTSTQCDAGNQMQHFVVAPKTSDAAE